MCKLQVIVLVAPSSTLESLELELELELSTTSLPHDILSPSEQT